MQIPPPHFLLPTIVMKVLRNVLCSFMLGLILVTAISSCSAANQPANVSSNTGSTIASPRSPVPTAQPTGNAASTELKTEVYKFGVPPWQKDQTIDDIRGRYKPLLDWLSQEIGHSFVIVGAKDYPEASSLLASGRIQIATISPAPYIAAKKQNPDIKMLVTHLSWNKDRTKKQDSYLGYILTLKSRKEISSATDLKGKTFGFVSKESTSGFVVPNAALQANGIDYKTFFGKTFFLGSHPRVTDAIAAGSIDAGATWDFNWNEAVAKYGDIFKPILTTPAIQSTLLILQNRLTGTGGGHRFRS